MILTIYNISCMKFERLNLNNLAMQKEINLDGDNG